MTKCFRCDSLYDETTQWFYGWREKNSTAMDSFHPMGEIKLGDCPICRKPPMTEAPPSFSACM